MKKEDTTDINDVENKDIGNDDIENDDIENNDIENDDDNDYIVSFKNGDFVVEEYEPSDIAAECENDDKEYTEEYVEDEEAQYEDDTEEEYEYNEEYVETEYEDEGEEGYIEYAESEYEGNDNEEYDGEYDDESEYYEEDNDDAEYYGEVGNGDDDEYDEEYHGFDNGDDVDDGGSNTFSDKIKNLISEFTVFDAIVAVTGVAVVIAAIIVGAITINTRTVNRQIDAIAPLGNELSDIGIIGGDGLLAMTDAALGGVLGEEIVSEELSTQEDDEESTTYKVSVSFTSVEKDLKIRFTDVSSGELITGTAFEVTLTSSKGKQLVLTDSDMDGVIYADNITAGVYDVIITSTDRYKFPTTAQQVTVKDKVEYVVINNIQDEVKTEKQVDVAVEDTQVNDAAKEEETLKDTVEWVEESKTPISASDSYILVDKSTIPDPSQLSRLSSIVLFAADNVVELDKSEASLKVGESVTVNIVTSPKDHEDDDYEYKYSVVGWSSDNSGVATVDGGVIKAVAAGEASVKYTVKEEKTKKQSSQSETTEASTEGETKTSASETAQTEVSEISASVKVKVEEVKVSITSSTLELKKSADTCTVGSTMTVSPSKITYQKSDGSTETIEKDFPTLTWESSDTTIATVDDKGVVTGVKAGKVNITARLSGDGGTSTSVEVEIVSAKELTLKLDRTSDVYIAAGGTTQLVATVENYTSDATVTWTTSDANVAKVDDKGTVTGVAVGSATITATTNEKNLSGNSVTASCVVTVTANAAGDRVTKLKDSNGNQIYIKNSDGSYAEAVYADYFTVSEFYIKVTASSYAYTGWQTIDGKTYYYDKNGVPVTGTQIINGVTYNFGSDGAIATTVNGSTFGIDVSRHNGTIDWNAVKASGVDFVIIRCGYRGSSTGALIEDQNFKTNIKGATAAGLKVGVYVFSQAINEVEAVKEASLAVSLVKGYNLTYPIFIDTESSGGRADKIDKATRTAVVNAFCQTVASAGYKPGIYASKTWFEDKLNMSSIGNYKIWLAQYAATPSYKSKYDMWQYSSKGKISGINGNVDLNYSYLGY